MSENKIDKVWKVAGTFYGRAMFDDEGTIAETAHDSQEVRRIFDAFPSLGSDSPERKEVNIRLAEAFAKCAVRISAVDEAIALIDVSKTDKDTVADLEEVNAPCFARLVERARSKKIN